MMSRFVYCKEALTLVGIAYEPNSCCVSCLQEFEEGYASEIEVDHIDFERIPDGCIARLCCNHYRQLVDSIKSEVTS